MGTFIDLTGQQYGRSKAIEKDIEKSKRTGRTYWICQCECGNKVSVWEYNLRKGITKSCGCLRIEKIVESNSKSNRIEFDSDLGCLRVYFNNTDEYFLCDVENRDIAEKYCWHKDKNGYAISSVQNKYNNICKHYEFHRLVMEKYGVDLTGYVVDHINNYVLDNRKNNLRKCLQCENIRNSKGYSNTGYKNIYYDKSRSTYNFTIMINGKRYIKRLNNLDEAIHFRDSFYKEHPDEFRYNSNKDYRNNKNIIQPFIFVDHRNKSGE